MRLTLFLLLSSLTLCKAQFYSVPNTIRTPYGNVTTYGNHHYPMYYPNAGTVSVKDEFTIVLKNDSVITARTRIDMASTHSVTIKQNGKKRVIKASETRSISRESSLHEKLEGVANDSCWLFKAVTAKINGYGYLAEKGYIYVVAIQDGDGTPILPLTKENLLPLVQDDPKAVKLANKNKLQKALEIFNKNTAVVKL